MAGLLEQYEQSSQMGPMARHQGTARPAAVVTPIFSKQKVNFRPASPITHLVVANNQLVIAMANKSLLRIDLLNPDTPQEVDLSRETVGSRIQHLFLDPSGQHLLVSTVPREGDLANASLLYIGGKTAKPRPVSQLRGQLISAVGWSHTGVTSSRTGPLLVGNSQGVVTELELCSEESMFSRLETYTKQVFDVGEQRSRAAITALEYHRIPETSRYMVLVATACRLYQFVETVASHEARPLLTAVFTTGGQISERFLEIPSSLSFSRLAFFYPKVGEPPDRFAWMTEPGILYGELDTSGPETILGETRLISHAGEESAPPPGAGKTQPPRAVALTQFHVLALQAARVRATCVLDQRHVFEDLANEEHGPLVTICRDPVRGTLWSAAERAVYKYKVVDETRDVWQVFVQRGEYELARRHCQNSPQVVDKILTHQAEACFAKEDYSTAARLFADSHRELEEVALKFVTKREYEPLREFLLSRLERTDGDQRLQSALLVFWALELYLTQLAVMKDREDPGAPGVRSQMMAFLTSNEALMHVRPARRAVYELMSRHGDTEAVTGLAERLQDWGTVLRLHLRNNHVLKAIETMRLHPDPDLIYEHISSVIQTEPTLTVDLIIGQGRRLQPATLLPRLVSDNRLDQGVEILRYLEFCVESLQSQCSVVHNYLVTLYVRYQPAKLMAYLRAQGLDRHCVHYTPGHVLRQCWSRLPQAAVHVLTVVERYQDAVELALKHDVSLAKEVANKPEDDDTLKKRLWLLIAKHIIRHDQDVQHTMQFLSECRLLHIEDVLPFFPDFVTIDDFKEAICDSLQSYNQHIDGLRSEMREATSATEVLREEIAHFRRGYVTIQAADTCQVCKHQLLSRPLYVFPCGHQFHQDCLTSEVMTYLTEQERRTVTELQHKLTTLPEDDVTASPAAAGQTTSRAAVREELDLLVAGECLYCGDYLIRCLDDPLLNDFPEDEPER